MFSPLELHEIAEADHRILNPYTDAHLMELAAVARVGAGTRVLDLACGKGEMLCRWAQELGSSGVGVDLSPVFAAAARHRAVELGVTERVTIEQADAGTHSPAQGAFDVAACVGATWIGGGTVGTIELLRPAVTATGLLLIGESFWRVPPPAEVRAIFGDRTWSPTCRACSSGANPPVPTWSRWCSPTSTAGTATQPPSGGP